MTRKKKHMLVAVLIGIGVLLLLAVTWPHSVQSLFGNMAEREYTVFSFDAPDSDYTLEAREWSAFRASGIDFYVVGTDGNDRLLDSVSTNEYLPFQHEDYRMEWATDSVTVYYGFSGSAEQKNVTLNLADYSVIDKDTGKPSNYLLRISTPEEIGLEPVTVWFSELSDGQGFSYYIYSDPDSWDVFLAVPAHQSAVSTLQNSDVSITVENSVLRVYITSDMDAQESDESRLIHFVAPARGAWPASVELVWNGTTLPCDGAYALP